MTTFTLVHVVLSLVGIGSGLVVLRGLLTANRFDSWTSLFLATTLLTSLTGFLFPFTQFLPSHAFGIISTITLAIAYYARYSKRLVGSWRQTYVVTAILALYLNVFVLVVQSFLKIPALNALAPTQSEPPFAIAQLVVLVLFVWLGFRAVKNFREPVIQQARRASA